MTEGQERDAWLDRRLRAAALWGGSSRIMAALVGVMTIPLIVHGLGPTNYGIFATVTAFGFIAGVADLGVSQGLVSRLASGRESSCERARLVATCFHLLCLAGLVMLATALVVGAVALANSDSPGGVNLVLIVGFYLGSMSFVAPSVLGLRLAQATHDGKAVAAIMGGATIVASLGATIGALFGSVNLAVSLFAAGPVVVGICATYRLVKKNEFSLSLSLWDGDTAAILGRSGILFFCLNVVAGLGYQLDTLIIARNLGLQEAGAFAIASRALSIVVQTTTAMTMQVWPAAAEALALGRYDWATQRIGRACLLSSCLAIVGCSSIGGIIWLFGSELFPKDSRPGATIVLVVSIWIVYQAAVFPLAMLLNALNMVGAQLGMGLVMLSINLPLSVFLVQHVGAAGVIIGSLVSHVASTLIPGLFLARKVMPSSR